MSRRLRIAMLLDWFVYYSAGVVNSLVDECDVLVVMRDHGHEMGLDRPARAERGALFDPRVQVCFVRGAQSDPTTLFSALSARRALRAFRPDVVHVQANVDWRLELVAESSRAPRVLTLHDVEPHPGAEGRGNRLQLWVQRRVFDSSDAVVVHGERLAQMVWREPWLTAHQDVAIVPLGPIELPAETSPPPEAPVALFFGRVEFYKGLDLLVEAAEIARERVPDLKVVIAGRGPDAERCRALVRHAETFEWREGFVADAELPALFASCSVVVLPYREASQSGVVPIAFGYGRAVIASDVGSLSEAVDPGVNGVLVPGEDVAALAEALVGVLASRDTLLRLTEGAAATVRTGKLSRGAVRDAHIAVYERLLGEGRSR